jgi:prepilin signal peptidase PulO-like enzyme (type II secretory pathway)
MLDWSLISPESAVAGLAVGGGFLLIIRYVANSLLKTDTIGLGDVKLMFAAGFGVGMPDILLVLSIGSLLGILHGYILQQVETKKTGKQTPLMNVNVPAGVGLSIATMGVISLQFWNWWEIF